MDTFGKSYALGTFPTLELLSHRPNDVTRIYISSKATPDIREKFSAHSLIVAQNDHMISRLSKAENIYVIGEFNRYTAELDIRADHVVLDRVSDMGNLGTIIRTMVGFNCFNLALVNPSADIFHLKVIRASMGAVFQINFSYFDSFSEYQSAFPRNYYPFFSDAGCTLQTSSFETPYSLIFGNEGAGLPDGYKNIGTTVKIEQSDNIDSLNLSVAAAVALHHAYVGHK